MPEAMPEAHEADLIMSIIRNTYPSDIEHLVNVVIRALHTSILRELTERRRDTQLD